MPLLPLTGAAIKGIFKSGLKYDLNPYKHNFTPFQVILMHQCNKIEPSVCLRKKIIMILLYVHLKIGFLNKQGDFYFSNKA